MLKHILLFAGIALWANLVTGQISLPPSGENQAASVSQNMGLVTATVDYSSPDVTGPNGESRRGQIWGTLVPYGPVAQPGFGTTTEMPWRAGANENTVFTTTHDIEVEGRALPAGSYGLHMIPYADKPWVVIFSKKNSAWGSYFYDRAYDALRVEVEPVENEFHEDLTYEFEDRESASTTLTLQWEEVKVPLRLSVPNATNLYLAQIENELEGALGFQWQNWQQAANYALTQNRLEQAKAWSDVSIERPFVGQPNFQTLSTRAQILAAMDKAAESSEAMLAAVNHPTANPGAVHQMGRQMLSRGQHDMAMKIFQANAENNPEVWYVDVGLARAYSAMSAYKKALKHMKRAQENIPDGDPNTANLVTMIAQLEKGEDIN